MQVTTQAQAGGIALNHNQKPVRLQVQTDLQTGQGSGVGGMTFNHNQKPLRISLS